MSPVTYTVLLIEAVEESLDRIEERFGGERVDGTLAVEKDVDVVADFLKTEEIPTDKISVRMNNEPPEVDLEQLLRG